jgi:hypothetical protein
VLFFLRKRLEREAAKRAKRVAADERRRAIAAERAAQLGAAKPRRAPAKRPSVRAPKPTATRSRAAGVRRAHPPPAGAAKALPPQGVVRACHVRLLPPWDAVNEPHQSPNSDRHLDDRLEDGSWRTPHCKGRGWPLAQVCPRLGCRDRREAIWP